MTLYDSVMDLALRRGFFFPSCEIYAKAPAGFYEYGPLGVAMRNRFLESWRSHLIRPEGMIEIDGSSIMAKDVFQASGHLEGFADLIVQCGKCHSIYRADRLVAEKTGRLIPERIDPAELGAIIGRDGIKCPNCKGDLGSVSQFSTMFSVQMGPLKEEAYLRPETAQSIFVDFARIYKTMRCKLPFAIAQYGEAFRNEISPRQALMRLREFHQAEIEIFFNPNEDIDEKKYQSASESRLQMLLDAASDSDSNLKAVTVKQSIDESIFPYRLIPYYLSILKGFYVAAGVKPETIRFRRLQEDEKAFYAAAGFDLEVNTSLGWIELVACNYRTDHDLRSHSKGSGEDLVVQENGSKITPHVFELSMGVDRSLYVILEQAFVRENERALLKLPRRIAPVQVAIFPLLTKDGLPEMAEAVRGALAGRFEVAYDESGSIGRRYRRNDEIGVPAAVTVDYQTMQDETVTVRERDSMRQWRVPIADLRTILEQFLEEDILPSGPELKAESGN